MIKHFNRIKFDFLLWFKMLNKARFSLFALLVLSLFLVINMQLATDKSYLTNATSSSHIAATTDVVPLSHVSITVAYICIFVASILWGVFLLPIKHFDTGDGIFFQFVMCVSIWFTSIFVHAIRQFPTFYGWTVVGGVRKRILYR